MKIKRILSRNHTENALDNSFIIRETHEHASYKFQKQFSQSEYLIQFCKFFNECFRLFQVNQYNLS